MSSRLRPGSFRTMDATAFSTAFFVNPSMTSAEQASSVFAPEPPDERSRTGPLPRDILSFNSMITFWAVLSPMPFTAFMRLTYGLYAVDVPGGHCCEHLVRSQGREHHPGRIRTYAGDRDEQGENSPLLLVEETVQRLLVLPHVMIYVKPCLAGIPESLVGIQRYLHQIAYAAAFYHGLRRIELLDAASYIVVHNPDT